MQGPDDVNSWTRRHLYFSCNHQEGTRALAVLGKLPEPFKGKPWIFTFALQTDLSCLAQGSPRQQGSSCRICCCFLPSPSAPSSTWNLHFPDWCKAYKCFLLLYPFVCTAQYNMLRGGENGKRRFSLESLQIPSLLTATEEAAHNLQESQWAPEAKGTEVQRALGRMGCTDPALLLLAGGSTMPGTIAGWCEHVGRDCAFWEARQRDSTSPQSIHRTQGHMFLEMSE